MTTPGGRPLLRAGPIGILILGTLAYGYSIFGPANTVHYWQGWCFLLLSWVSYLGLTIAVVRKSPDLLHRRMQRKESRPTQRRVMPVFKVLYVVQISGSALDWRFHLSHVPMWTSIWADGLLCLGCWIIYTALAANQFAGSTIRVETEQTVIDTGVYGLVRHPFYLGFALMILATPLALGSAWFLIISMIMIGCLAIRLVNEEKMLLEELTGYDDYRRRVRYRLVPRVW